MVHVHTSENAKFDEALVRLVDLKPASFPSLGEWAASEPQDAAEATRAAFSEAGYRVYRRA